MEIIIQVDNPALMPTYATEGSSGADLCAKLTEPLQLMPGCRQLVKTGVRISIPSEYEAQVRPRSGLALKFGVTVLNSPGTIDSDYRGEIGVVLINHGSEPYVINPNDRIAQLIFSPISRARFVCSKLDVTVRADGAYGSTG